MAQQKSGKPRCLKITGFSPSPWYIFVQSFVKRNFSAACLAILVLTNGMPCILWISVYFLNHRLLKLWWAEYRKEVGITFSSVFPIALFPSRK